MSFLARVVEISDVAAGPFLGTAFCCAISWALCSGKNQGLAPKSTDSADGIPAASTARRLVRDPVCGLHVDETRSIPLREGASWFTSAPPLAAMRTRQRKEVCGERIKRIYIK